MRVSATRFAKGYESWTELDLEPTVSGAFHVATRGGSRGDCAEWPVTNLGGEVVVDRDARALFGGGDPGSSGGRIAWTIRAFRSGSDVEHRGTIELESR